ncbi:hypothetical protein RRG08_047353 [Elysia crispata]|uniref:Uncharacterized protein n=1 Tax=Elysia crispata TaxID=231223 RepID=A0AAE1E7V7_9GAST|nr:hypothetical protein RRG08_047353 [Elysia crispata]
MKVFIFFVFSAFVASALSAATDCSADVVQCETTFKAAANASGNDVTASCNAASAFLSCLDTKDNSPECASVKPAIEALRSTYASQIQALGCNSLGPAGSGPLKCSKDIQACQQQFVVDDTKAGNDNTKACQAGEVLGNCLNSIEGKPECGGAKKLIDSLRGSYHDQINTQGCAAIIRPQQTQCQKDVVVCQQTFQAAVKVAPNNAVEQCHAGVVFMACLDKYDHQVECLAAQSAISSMRSIFSKQIAAAGCGDGAKPTVTACQGDVMGCVKGFTDAMKIAGNNVDKQCSAGAAMTKCFDEKDKAPECAAVKDTIASLRNTFSSQIRTDGCAGNADPSDPKIKCSLDISDCEETFQTQVNDAGTDVKSQCLAGATLEACLSQVDQNSVCSSSKSSVDALKDFYKQQIDQTTCASKFAEKCAEDVQTCSNTFHTKFNAQTSDDGRCKTSNTYVKCLNGVTCSKSFDKQLTTAVMMVQGMLSNNTSPCDLVKFNPHGAASSLTTPTTTLVMSLLLAMYALTRQ